MGVRRWLWLLLLLSTTIHAEDEALLRNLGMDAAVAQLPALVELSLQGAAFSTLAQEQRDAVAASLEQALQTSALHQAMTDALQNQPGDLRNAGAAALSEELAQRVRNFDQVFGVEGAPQKFDAYRDQLAEQPPRAERLALIRELDSLTATSAQAAWLQTAVEDCAAQRALTLTGQAPPLPAREQRLRQREATLQALAVDLSLYSYRFLRDDELRAYRDLVSQPAVRQLRESAWGALQTTLSQRCAQ